MCKCDCFTDRQRQSTGQRTTNTHTKFRVSFHQINLVHKLKTVPESELVQGRTYSTRNQYQELVPQCSTRNYNIFITITGTKCVRSYAHVCECVCTCLMAISPILSECLRMLSKKSRSCVIAVSLMCVLSLGIFSAIMEQNRYWPALGRQVCSSCSRVLSAG